MTDNQSTEGSPEPEERQSLRILALISVGHALSNFYVLCLPPLIPFFREEFGVSYAALGMMLSIRAFTTGTMQVPMGILVDRVGAKIVLVGGLVLMSAGFGLIAFVPGYWWTLSLTFVLGVGMSTLRPANYTIINASMPLRWMGRAFAVNVFSGHAGRAVAPAVIIGIAAFWGWRGAVLACGVAGIVLTAGLVSQWRHVRDDTKPKSDAPPAPTTREQVRVLLSRSVVLFFLFYTLTSLTTNGIQSFSVVALTQLHNTPIEAASGALTGYLVASAIGVLAGGFAADKTSRHEVMAVLVLIGSALLIMLLGSVSLPIAAIVTAMSLVGLLQGAMRPARDMLVRAILPRAIFGKAIATVSTGAAIGGSVAPVLFGWIMDIGQAQWVFYILGFATVLVAVTIIWPKKPLTLDNEGDADTPPAPKDGRRSG